MTAFSIEIKDRIKMDLYQAYYDCRKHKRNTLSALAFEICLEEKLKALYNDLTGLCYKPGRCVVFIVNRPVIREIFAADFRDRIIHHFVVNRLNPFFERLFIHDSYSCRKAKGTLFGIRRAEYFIRSCSKNYTEDCYILKLDILGFFMHIDRKILYAKVKGLIRRYYTSADKPLMEYLCREIILQNPVEHCIIKGETRGWNMLPGSKSLFHMPKGVGLPIGNLTSQLFANLYMNDFDHFVKRELKVRYYGRYVDDMIFVSKTREELCRYRDIIRVYLKEKLNLDIHPKKEYLQHYTRGFSFLGAYIKPYRTYIAKRTVKNFNHVAHDIRPLSNFNMISRAGLEQQESRIISYLGLMKHFKTYRLINRLKGHRWQVVYQPLFNGIQ